VRLADGGPAPTGASHSPAYTALARLLAGQARAAGIAERLWPDRSSVILVRLGE